MNAKRSNIGWAISDYTTFYRTGGTPAVTSLGSGTLVVTTTPIREGQYIFAWTTEDSTGQSGGNFIAIALSSGTTVTYRVISGTAFSSGSGYTTTVIVSSAFFNVPSSDFQTDNSTVTYSNTTHRISLTSATLAIGDLVIIQGCVSSGLLPTVWFIGEITATDGTYRVLLGTEVAQNTLANTILRTFSPKYCVMNLEGIDLAELVNVMDSDNGTYTFIQDGQSFDGLGNNPMYDNTVCYNLRDNNQLDVYRGITSDNGVFLIGTQIDYLTEKPIVTQQMPSE